MTDFYHHNIPKERGVRFGKKKALSAKPTTELKKRHEAGGMIKTFMKNYSLSKTSGYQYMKGQWHYRL